MLTIKEGFWMSEEEAPGAGWEAGLAKDIGEALATAEGGPVAGAAVGALSDLKAQRDEAKALKEQAKAETRMAKAQEDQARSSRTQGTGKEALIVPTFALIVLGLVIGFLKFFGQEQGISSGYLLFLSVVASFLAAWIVSEKYDKAKYAVFFPLMLFLAWVVVFQTRYDALFIGVYGAIAAVLIFFAAYASHGEATGPELSGILIGIIFLLDVGGGAFVLDLLETLFGLAFPDLVSIFVVAFPWWIAFAVIFVGSFGEGHKYANLLLQSFTIILGLLIFTITLLAVSSHVPFTEDFLWAGQGPSADELLSSQQARIVDLSEGDVNSWERIAIQFHCLFESAGDLSGGGDSQDCIDEGEAEVKAEKICDVQYDVQKEKGLHVECVDEQTKEILQGDEQEGGSTYDDAINYVEVSLAYADQGEGRGQTVVAEGDFNKLIYLFDVEIVVPSGKSFSIDSSCKFTKGKDEVEGIVGGVDKFLGLVSITESVDDLSYSCRPTADIEGKWTVKFSLELLDMETRSFISPIFTSNEDKYAEIISQLQSSLHGLDTIPESVPEFARLNVFVDDGIVELGEASITTTLNVENFYEGGRKGAVGVLTNVHGYDIYYNDAFEQNTDNSECFDGYSEDVLLSEDGLEEGEKLFVTNCFMEIDSSFAEDIADQNAAPHTIEGWLVYDYRFDMVASTENIEVEWEEEEEVVDTDLDDDSGTVDSGDTSTGGEV
ncbi:hypothetical protein HOC01_05760 [archaeon]|nr:hypothetical protein [archaeon]MBT6697653.1 hypothetical protein [archaeon]